MMHYQLFKQRSFLLLSLTTCFLAAAQVDNAYHESTYASMAHGTFVQDARWQQLTQFEQSIFLDLTQGKFGKVLYDMQYDISAYSKLAGMYDLLWITLTTAPYSSTDNQKTFILFLLSQGVVISDKSVTFVTHTWDSWYIEKFLEFGFNPNYTLANGDTLLISLVKNQDINVELVGLLIQAGASPLIKDASEKNVYDYCPLVFDKKQWLNQPLLITLYGSKTFYASNAYKEWLAHLNVKVNENDDYERLVGIAIAAAFIAGATYMIQNI
ncbi:MAG TPA: hypothetical protein VLG50_03130 [Candidatus Saccharimonadales bacterium]|nr:hypothetical protein [Candidatus Saccharimonadales bacterium]